MAKRAAVKQGGKDVVDDGDDDIQDVPTFNSNPEEIARRQIKGLPKRGAAAAPETSKNSSNVPSVPKFTGFSGFGSTTTSTPQFSFDAQLSQSSASSSSLPPFTPPSTTPSFTSFTPPSAPFAESDDSAFEYYASLRGLNHSLLTSFQEAIRTDAFADLRTALSDALDHYQQHRSEIQNAFDSKQRKPQPVPAAKSTPPSVFPSMPVMPLTGFSFGGKSLPISSPASTSSTSGFALKPPGGGTKPEDKNNPPSSQSSAPTKHIAGQPSSTSTGFSFGGAPEPQSSKSTGSEKESKPASAFSGFGAFGARKPEISSSNVASESTSSKPLGGAADSQLTPKDTAETPKDNASPEQTETDAKSSSQISSGSSTGASLSPFSAFSSTAKSEDATPAASKFPSWGAAGFGSGSTTTSTSAFGSFSTKGSFSFKPPTEPGPTSALGSSSSSGATSTPSFGSSGTFSTPSKPPAITFGSGSSSTKSPLFGASSSKTLGNPVGFAFGSPPKDNPFVTVAPSGKSEKVGEASTSTSASEGANLFGSPSDSREDTPQSDSEMTLHDTAAVDSEGEGEENEVSLFTTRAKLLKFVDNKWVSQGTGFFKIKKNSETGKRRVLFRFDATKKIGANFNVFAGMKITSNKTLATFPGLDGETVTMYGIKLATPEQAREAVAALEEAVEAVKGGN